MDMLRRGDIWERERERERVIMKRGVFCVVMGLGPTHKSTVHLKSDSQLTVPRCRLTDKFRRDFVSVIFFASSTPTIFFPNLLFYPFYCFFFFFFLQFRKFTFSQIRLHSARLKQAFKKKFLVSTLLLSLSY